MTDIPTRSVTVDDVVAALKRLDASGTRWFWGYEVRNNLIDHGQPCSYQGVGNALRWADQHGRVRRDQVEHKRALWQIRGRG